MNNWEIWVKCEVVDGMFENEKAVSVKTPDLTVSFFLEDLTCLKVEDGQAMVRCFLIDQSSGRSLVKLPHESIEAGRIVLVEDSEILQYSKDKLTELDSELEELEKNIEKQKFRIENLQKHMDQDRKIFNISHGVTSLILFFLLFWILFG